jgi:hypothetical protein
VLLLLIDSGDLLGDTFETFGDLVECPLLSQLYILLHLLEFMFDLGDEAVLVGCDGGDHRLSKTTAFEFII